MLMIFSKAKSYCNSFWASLVKYQLYVMELYNLLCLKNEWMNCANFLHAHTQSGKLKVTLGARAQIWR